MRGVPDRGNKQGARSSYAMTFDSLSQRIYMYGGKKFGSFSSEGISIIRYSHIPISDLQLADSMIYGCMTSKTPRGHG